MYCDRVWQLNERSSKSLFVCVWERDGTEVNVSGCNLMKIYIQNTQNEVGLYRIIPDQTIGQKSEHSHVSTLTKQLITFSTSMIYKTITFTQSQRNSAVTTCAIWLSVCMSHSKIRWCVRVITEFNSIENHPFKTQCESWTENVAQ